MSTLSQYLGDIKKRRDNEMAERLQAVLPYMQYEVNRTKEQEKYTENLGKYRTDLSLQFTDEGLKNEFLGTQHNTIEGAQQHFGTLMGKQKYNSYSTLMSGVYEPLLDDAGKEQMRKAVSSSTTPEELQSALSMIHGKADERQDIQKSIQDYQGFLQVVDPEGKDTGDFAKYAPQMSSVDAIGKLAEYSAGKVKKSDQDWDAEAETKLAPEYLEKYRKLAETTSRPSALVQMQHAQENAWYNEKLSIGDRHEKATGGTTGGGNANTQMKVDANYTKQRDKVFRQGKGSGYVTMSYNGENVRVPARVGTDGRIYLIGANGEYAANPFDFIDMTKEKAPSTIMPKTEIDRWNSAAPAPQDAAGKWYFN